MNWIWNRKIYDKYWALRKRLSLKIIISYQIPTKQLTHHDIVSLHFRFFLSKFFALQFEAEKNKTFIFLIHVSQITLFCQIEFAFLTLERKITMNKELSISFHWQVVKSVYLTFHRNFPSIHCQKFLIWAGYSLVTITVRINLDVV